jgi:predicted nucleotidyltransferase
MSSEKADIIVSNPERWRNFKPLPPNIRQRLEHLTSIFQRSNVRLAYLFGSLAQDRPGNDVDLAILRNDGPALELYAAISGVLGTERLDLVDLRTASAVVRFEVMSTGRLLYAAEEDSQLDFERETLRVYKDAAWRRRRQEDILRARITAWLSNEVPSPNE